MSIDRKHGLSIEDLFYFKDFEDNLSGDAMTALELVLKEDGWELTGHADKFTVLSPSEMVQLSWVATTKDEAAKILDRNEWLLACIVDKRKIWSNIGCPHCLKWTYEEKVSGLATGCDYACSRCAWNVIPSHEKVIFCRTQTFGGYSLPDVHVSYDANGEGLEELPKELEESESYLDQDSAVFLAGHIEWALMLLNDHLPVVDRPFREWTKEKQEQWIVMAKGLIGEGNRRG